MQKTYSEKLQNPLWQKCRLLVLKRDKFKCKLCKDDQSTLHVHHKTYEYSKEPWEYELSNFETYCKCCHAVIEKDKNTTFTIQFIRKRKTSDINTDFILAYGYSHKDKLKGVMMYTYNNKTNFLEHLTGLGEHCIKSIILDIKKVK